MSPITGNSNPVAFLGDAEAAVELDALEVLLEDEVR
jgi:hypothetical protein